MIANTGTLSFILYGIFIAIAIVGLFIAIYFIKKDNIPADKLEKIIDLSKYTIVSVCIATVTLIISDLFKEREQDVKELEYFDKYAQDVKKVDGIQERFELSKYLSIVAPTGELKRSWQQYYDTLKIDYYEYIRLKKEKEKLDTIGNPTDEQILRKQELNEKIEQKESPLVTINNQNNQETSAAKFESQGFQFLLQKDVEGAIAAFNNAEQSSNGYHMVYDIWNYLRKNKSSLNDPENQTSWNKAYSDVIKNFSWKMPADVKQKMSSLSK